MSKHDQNRAEKRDRLLRAGLDAFTETGYDNTTVSDIVRRAAMTPSTFYNYFRDKDALLEELLERLADELLSGLKKVRGEASDVEDFARRAAQAFFAGLTGNKGRSMLIKRNLPLVRSLVDHEALAVVLETLRTDIGSLTEGASERGGDLHYAAVVFRAGVVELGISLLGQPGAEIDKAAGFAAAMLSGGLRVAGGAS